MAFRAAISQRILLAATTLGMVLVGAGCGSRSAGTASAPAEMHAGKGVPSGVKLRTGAEIPFEHSWDLKLPKPVRRSWISENVPELVFFEVQDDLQIYAVDVMSGATRWVTQPLPSKPKVPAYVSRVHPTQTTTEDRLWVISDDTLFCFDGSYGQLVWRHPLSFSASSAPMAVGEDGPENTQKVFIGDWAGHLRVITYQASRHFSYELWQWNLFAPITAPPVDYEKVVYVADHAGVLSAFDYDRKRSWFFTLGGAIDGGVMVRGHTTYVGSDQNVLYALNRLSGEQLGSVPLNAPIRRTPFGFAGEPGRVYVWTTDDNPRRGGLWAIDTQSDKLNLLQDVQGHPRSREVERMTKVWYVGGATDLISSTPEHLYVLLGGDDTVVHAVNRATGKIDWAWDLNDKSKSPRPIGGKVAHVLRYHDPSDDLRSIITVDGDGQVVAYRLFGYRAKDKVIATKIVQPPAGQKPAKKAAPPPAAAQ